MAQLLHIVTKPNDSLAEEVIQRQRTAGGNQVEVVDLTRGESNYAELVEKIFAADSVQVW